MVLNNLKDAQRDLENLERFVGSEFQSYGDLAKAPLNKVIVGNGFTKEKIYEDSCKMSFKYVIQPNIELPFNWHNCLEIATTNKGLLQEVVSGEVVEVGKAVNIKKGNVHSLKNIGTTELLVTATLFKDLK